MWGGGAALTTNKSPTKFLRYQSKNSTILKGFNFYCRIKPKIENNFIKYFIIILSNMKINIANQGVLIHFWGFLLLEPPIKNLLYNLCAVSVWATLCVIKEVYKVIATVCNLGFGLIRTNCNFIIIINLIKTNRNMK